MRTLIKITRVVILMTSAVPLSATGYLFGLCGLRKRRSIKNFSFSSMMLALTFSVKYGIC